MTGDSFTVSRQQADEIFKALRGIRNLVEGLTSKRANASEVYAIISNLALIQLNLTGMPRVNPN